MSKQRRFMQCDVFTSQPTRGNALAVVLDGTGLSDEAMQAFARWTNLAETTFLLPPTHSEADYKVRIFTPKREMPFAGHPTLGSCMCWLKSGGIPQTSDRVTQECQIGLVDIDLSGELPAFVAPPTKIQSMPDAERQRIAERLGLKDTQIRATTLLDNGPEWHVFELENAQQVLDVDSARVRWPEFRAIGLIGPHSSGHELDFEVRNLAPSSGMSEDPITGSLNAALACWLQSEGRLRTSTRVAQGTNVDRVGRVSIDIDPAGRILIGGAVQFLIEGTVQL